MIIMAHYFNYYIKLPPYYWDGDYKNSFILNSKAAESLKFCEKSVKSDRSFAKWLESFDFYFTAQLVLP